MFQTAIQCYSDTECNSTVGSEKKTVEECCESFENGGLGGVHYSIGDLCFDCLNSLGKTITHSLVFFVPMIISV